MRITHDTEPCTHCGGARVEAGIFREFSAAMRAGFAVDAFVGDTQTLDRPAMHEVFLHNLRRVFGPHASIPDRIRINHDRWPMLALIEAAGLVDAHFSAEAGVLGLLLQHGEKLAFAIFGAGRAWSALGAHIVADENVTFKDGQAVFLLDWIISD